MIIDAKQVLFDKQPPPATHHNHRSLSLDFYFQHKKPLLRVAKGKSSLALACVSRTHFRFLAISF